VPAEFGLALEYPFKPTAIKALGIKEIEIAGIVPSGRKNQLIPGERQHPQKDRPHGNQDHEQFEKICQTTVINELFEAGCSLCLSVRPRRARRRPRGGKSLTSL
jgi:hypothetical protein